MNKKLSGIFSVLLSVLVLVFFESLVYKVFNIVGFNINNYSNLLVTIINLSIKIMMCIIIYFIYKRDFRRNRSSNNVFKMLLFLIIGVILLTFVMYLFNYVIKYIASMFKVDIINDTFYNIFDKKLDTNLILKIISDYVIIPFLYVSTVILSIDKLTRRKDTFMLFSGLLAGVIYALSLNGTLLFVTFNSLGIFILFCIFALCYRKINSIWFVIFLYSIYLISNVLILNYLGL